MSAGAAILAADARGVLNRLRRGRRRTRALVLWTIGGVALAFFLAGAAGLGGLLGSFGPALGDPVMVAGFTSMGLFMLLVGFSSVVSAFFADRELQLLAVAPVDAGSVFWPRLAGAAWSNASVGAVLVAAVAGYGIGARAAPLYYLAALAAVVLQVVWVTSLQLVLLAGVVRLAPAGRVRDVANIVAALAAMTLYIGWAGYRGSFAGTGARGVADLTGTMARLGRNLGWLPTAWPAHALAGWASGAGAVWLAVETAFTACLLGAAYALFRAGFRSGVGAFTLGGGRVRRSRREAAARPGGGSDVLAIVRKDLLNIRRDTRRLVRILPVVALAVAYPFVVATGRGGGAPGLSAYFVLVFIAFMPAQVFGLPAVALEGRAFQLLRLAGIPPARLLTAKMLATVLPVAAVCLAGAVSLAIERGQGAGTAVYAIADVLWLGAGCSVISVSAGTLAPRFDSPDPRRAVGGASALTCSLGCLWFGALSVGGASIGALALTGIPPQAAAYLTPQLAMGLALGAVVLALVPAAVLVPVALRSLAVLEVA